MAAPDAAAIIVANGGSELATAGTGDVLCGVIAAMVARTDAGASTRQREVVASAAWVHGDAGRRTGLGPSMTATDLIAMLPTTLTALRQGEREPNPNPIPNAIARPHRQR